jgi:hypothetical protein
MQGRRSSSERKLSKTHGQKHKTKQKDSARTRQNVAVKYLNRKIVEELHDAIIAETDVKEVAKWLRKHSSLKQDETC